MKKLILSAILLIGCVAFTNAQCAASENQAVSTDQTAVTDEYKEVALTDLCQVIQKAVADLAGDTFDVKKVEYNAEKVITRVTLVNKDDQSEKLVLLDKAGKEMNDDAEPAVSDQE